MSEEYSIGGTLVANIKNKALTLRNTAGAFELNLEMKLEDRNIDEEFKSEIFSADISYSSQDKHKRYLGTASLAKPVVIESGLESKIYETLSFRLPISLSQMINIERERAGSDIVFNLNFNGDWYDENHKNSIHFDLTYELSKSDWADKLRQSKFLDIEYVEIPFLPPENLSENWLNHKEKVRKAQNYFLDGDYRAVVSICRDIIEDIGNKGYKDQYSFSDCLNHLGNKNGCNRKEMSKEKRMKSILAVIRHYTHQAKHSDSDGGEMDYNRQESKMILAMTSLFLKNTISI